MSHVERFPHRHPLCNCPEITFRDLARPRTLDMPPCRIHRALSTEDVERLAHSLQHKGSGDDERALRA